MAVPSRKLKVGKTGARVVIKNNSTKEEREVQHVEKNITGTVEEYQRVADTMGVDLSTALRVLPRGGLSMGATIAQKGSYSSVRVDVWLEQTFPESNPRKLRKHYDGLTEKVDAILGQVLEQAQKAVFED